MRESIRLLMIDDSSSDVFLIQEILGSSLDTHFQIETCPTLASGLDRLGENHFDLVLLDLSLIDSRGPETFYQVHAAFPDVAVIVMSGVDDSDSIKAVVEAGAQDYLVKGEINPRSLKRAILNSVVRKNRERDLGLYQTTFDGIRTGILICDESGKIILINRAAARLHDRPASEFKGQPIAAFSSQLQQCFNEGSFKKEGTIGHHRVEFRIDPISIPPKRKGFAVTILPIE